MLLCADWVLPISSPPLAEGAVLVGGGIIQAVGPAAELRARYPEETVHEFLGCALLPGLVNAHTHLEFCAFRDFVKPCGFGTWMMRLLLARRKLDLEDMAASALWGAHECARSGVTCIADTSSTGWAVARAARAVGLRARIYLEIFGLDDAQLPVTMERMEGALERLQHECEPARSVDAALPAAGTSGSGTVGGDTPMVEAGLSPHAPYTVSARLYREAARFARRAGLRLATHVAESQAEVRLLVRGGGPIAHAYRAVGLWKGQRWAPAGVSPVRYLAQAGALGPDTLAVHAVQVDGDDIATLAAGGAAVAHCPRSNLRLRCGSAPVAEMKTAGISVGLGTDSLASNDSLDMFAEMRAALVVSRARAAAGAPPALRPPLATKAAARQPVPLTPADVLRMATLDGARALGWAHLVGSLEAGKCADVVAVRLVGGSTGSKSHEPIAGRRARAGDPTAVLVETAAATDVRMTMVDGAVIYHGECLPAGVTERLDAVREKLGLAPA